MTDLAAPSRLVSLVDYARREPGRCLAAVLVLHVVIWSALPALLSHNLQLDLAEDLALGREWQLGYWCIRRCRGGSPIAYLVGDVRAVYLLGPLSAAVCMYWCGCSAATSSAASRRDAVLALGACAVSRCRNSRTTRCSCRSGR